MNLPNRITLFRMLLVPVMVVLMMQPGRGAQIAAACVFAVAAASDFLDGHIARSRNLVTDFGKFVDPIADKLLVTSAMILLVEQGRMAGWMVILFVAREFIISAFRMIAASKSRVIAADKLGKFKTIAQIAALLLTMFFTPMAGQSALYGAVLPVVASTVMYVALALSLWSCAECMFKNQDVL